MTVMDTLSLYLWMSVWKAMWIGFHWNPFQTRISSKMAIRIWKSQMRFSQWSHQLRGLEQRVHRWANSNQHSADNQADNFLQITFRIINLDNYSVITKLNSMNPMNSRPAKQTCSTDLSAWWVLFEWLYECSIGATISTLRWSDRTNGSIVGVCC